MRKYPSIEVYRNAWKDAPTKLPEIPLNIDIELSSICNLKCPFCVLSSKEYQTTGKKFMGVTDAYDIMEEASSIGVPAIKLNWLGEPTLHPDFTLIMKWANKFSFHDIIVNTNGNYQIDKNRGMTMATKAIFSIDSFEPETYDKMRGGDLVQVIYNIRDLLAKGCKNIIARRTITEDNKEEDFKQAVYESFNGKVKAEEHHVFDRAVDKTLSGVKDIERVYCGYPSQRLVIDTNLNCFPCCVDTGKKMLIGNKRDHSLEELWHMSKLEGIRNALKRNNMPSTSCLKCRSWISYDAPERKELIK